MRPASTIANPPSSPDGRQIAYLSGDCRSGGGGARHAERRRRPASSVRVALHPLPTTDLRVLVGGMLIDPEGARPGESTEYTQWSRDGTLALAPGHKVVGAPDGRRRLEVANSPPRSTMVQVRLLLRVATGSPRRPPRGASSSRAERIRCRSSSVEAAGQAPPARALVEHGQDRLAAARRAERSPRSTRRRRRLSSPHPRPRICVGRGQVPAGAPGW